MSARSTPARYWSTRPSSAAKSVRPTTLTFSVTPEAIGQGVDVVLIEGGDRIRQFGPQSGLEDHLVLENLEFRFGQQELQG
jgi:hypothetical protein